MIEIDDKPIEGMIALGSGSDASDQEIKDAIKALGIKTTLPLDEMVTVFKMYHKDCSDSEIAVSLGDRKKMRNVERVRVKCPLTSTSSSMLSTTAGAMPRSQRCLVQASQRYAPTGRCSTGMRRTVRRISR